jgi:hypothetical protein
MKTRTLLGALMLSALATTAQAQRGMPPGHQHRMGGSCPANCGYDTTTVSTVTGQIASVDPMMGGMGIHLSVRVGDATLPVHLGPATVLASQGFAFQPGQWIEVTGSRVQMGGGPALIAAIVRLDGRVLTLRDRTGRPTWAPPGAPPGK